MKDQIKKFNLYLADLNPQKGTEPGKARPVVVIQTDLLNDQHLSTIICPITTNLVKNLKILRLNLNLKQNGLKNKSAVLIDQIRAIDNKRFIKGIGKLNEKQKFKLLKNLKIILFE
jgi:mRNA interferase MazF